MLSTVLSARVVAEYTNSTPVITLGLSWVASRFSPLPDDRRYSDDELNYDRLVNFFCTLFYLPAAPNAPPAGDCHAGGAFYAADTYK